MVEYRDDPEGWLGERNASRCTRIAKAHGSKCEQPRRGWPEDAPLPDPQSCRWHLTDEEREILAESWKRTVEKQRHTLPPLLPMLPATASLEALQERAAEQDEALRRWNVERDPICWLWPAPETCTFGDEEAASRFLGWWNRDCAICGSSGEFVEDHDHRTGLVRGLLCRSCNVREGKSDAPVFQKYRQKNPASILGVSIRYWSPFAGNAVPTQRATELSASLAV